MKKILLSPDQIVTLTDFPVHNGHILKIYFKMCQEGAWKLVPPCPVMKVEIALQRLTGKGQRIARYNSALVEFLKKHPNVKYALLDGSHRTTAATLAHKKTATILLENDDDVRRAHELVEKGELLNLMVDEHISDFILDIQKHFLKKPVFETVEEKTRRMIEERVVPKYMENAYLENG